MLSKALLGFSVPDKQPIMTAHYNRGAILHYNSLTQVPLTLGALLLLIGADWRVHYPESVPGHSLCVH